MGWLHRLFKPHCEHCREESICESCETLKEQLSIANAERKQMLETILNFAKPVAEEAPDVDIKELKPIAPQIKPWRIRQEMLEKESRKKARILRERADTEKLEKEVIGEDENAEGKSDKVG